MPNAILDALSLLDATGRAILAGNVASLLAALGAHISLGTRYASLAREVQADAPRSRARSCAALSQKCNRPRGTQPSRTPRPSSKKRSRWSSGRCSLCGGADTEKWPDGSVIEFTFFWREARHWEGRNYSVAIRGAGNTSSALSD
jgi:hypothetical protein